MSEAPAGPRAVRATPAVVAAGLVAVLGGAFGAVSAAALLVLSATSALAGRMRFPPYLRPVLYAIWGFFLLSAVFVAVAGVGVIRLRRWARIGLLVVGGCMLFFGLVGIVVILFTLFFAVPDPAVSKAALAAVLSFVYGTPVAVGLWWLVLFSKRAVREQFETAGAASPAPSRSFWNDPLCPLPARIVGWYLASFLLLLPLVPFFPGLPAFYFGHVFRGPAVTLLLMLHIALLAIPGLGLLLRKRWSYPAVFATQLLLCANAVSGAFGGSFEAFLRSALAEMALPAFSAEWLLPYLRYFHLLGLVVPAAILAALLACRRRFYAAADSPPPEP